MYTDTIFFILGAVFGVILIISAVYFIVSSRKSKAYKEFLLQETEYYNTAKEKSTLNRTSKKDNTAQNEITVLENPDITVMPEETSAEFDLPEDINPVLFDGRYEIEKEILGSDNKPKGGMSRVFIARNIQLGNKWIIKFVPHQLGEVKYEYEKLKDLNHISLPKIVDIFDDDKGIYLVESYIEGETLQEVTEVDKTFNYFRLLDYMTQLCGVYSYLHSLPDSPLYHLDIKPSNIMVTHGDRLVPIDFGIAKRRNDSAKTLPFLSLSYAAPEQFGNTSNTQYKQIMDMRFGELPEDYKNWSIDARTDIFSIGAVMFELAVGEKPDINNISKIKDAVSSDFADIVLKCMKLNPEERYQTADDILNDLQVIKVQRGRLPHVLLMRRIAAIAAVLAFTASTGSILGGAYIYRQESLADVGIEPNYITLSLQQSGELMIEKEMPNGQIIEMDANHLSWFPHNDGVAQIDGNRVFGLNTGKTIIEGRYRNHIINLEVNVVEPMNGTVNMSQKYELNRRVSVFGGTLDRDYIDGNLSGGAEFVSPDSIDTAEDGTVYIADSGYLRKITADEVFSIDIEPFYMKPVIVRCYKNSVYILTNEWEEPDGSYRYGIVKIQDDGSAENIYITDAAFSAIEDFAFSAEDNLLYFIERSAGLDSVYLKVIDLDNLNDIKTVTALDEGTVSLADGGEGRIYLTNAQNGVIQYYDRDEEKLVYFAGITGEKAFINGNAPLFYMPQRIKYADNALYVWDFNVLRKITIQNGVLEHCITLAGEASPEYDFDYIEHEYAAESVILPYSIIGNNTDYTLFGSYILINDPKRGVIWKFE